MKWLLILVLAMLAAGCERARQDMYDQPRYKTFAASPMFADGSSARVAPAGAVPFARGQFADSTGGRTGSAVVEEDLAAERAHEIPYPVTMALLKRGQNRYTIYCVPCHSLAGDGDGLVVRRGFPAPPSYHSERLRNAPDRHFYDVISKGYGIMYPYADRIEPADRWAIVAYIRALQLSQHAPAADLPRVVRARLDTGGFAAAKGTGMAAPPAPGAAHDAPLGAAAARTAHGAPGVAAAPAPGASLAPGALSVRSAAPAPGAGSMPAAASALDVAPAPAAGARGRAGGAP